MAAERDHGLSGKALARLRGVEAIEKGDRLRTPRPAARREQLRFGKARGRAPARRGRSSSPAIRARGAPMSSPRRRHGSQTSSSRRRPAPGRRGGTRAPRRDPSPRTPLRPARSAIVRATRRTRSCPRPLRLSRSRTASSRAGARVRAALAAGQGHPSRRCRAPRARSRAAWRSRAAITRARPGRERLAAPPVARRARGSATGSSLADEIDAVEQRAAQAPLVARELERRARSTRPAVAPHGQRLQAATSMAFARELERALAARDLDRALLERLPQRLERHRARTRRSSSRNRTPRCASVISPGRGPAAAADQPGAEIVWWGARNGRSVTSRPVPSPAALWILRDLERLRRRSGGGRMPGSRRASMVLPAPGGPIMSRLWPPAAAISSARLASSWPRTSREVRLVRAGVVRPRSRADADRAPSARAAGPRAAPSVGTAQHLDAITSAASAASATGTNRRR